jgi:hypothetical protein
MFYDYCNADKIDAGQTTWVVLLFIPDDDKSLDFMVYTSCVLLMTNSTDKVLILYLIVCTAG